MKWTAFFLILCGLSLTPKAHAQVVGQSVEYLDGETVLEGYIAYDDEVIVKRPAVLVVPEWKGLTGYAKGRAEQLAELGYVGFAVDMYGKGIRVETHEEAAKISGIYRNDRELMRSRAKAALNYISNQPQVDPSRLTAIGYCFGGTTVLEMARAGFPLLGVASFHGGFSAPLPAAPGSIQAKVRVFHGDEDASVSAEDVEAFRAEMRNAEADWQMTIFGGAVHSFTVPEAGSDKSTGMAYNETADKDSWKSLTVFLKEIFESVPSQEVQKQSEQE